MYLQPHPSVVELAANRMGWDPWIGEAGGKSGCGYRGIWASPKLGCFEGGKDRTDLPSVSCTSDRARETQAVLIGGLIRIRAGQLIVSSFHFLGGDSCSLGVASITLITTTPQRRTQAH